MSNFLIYYVSAHLCFVWVVCLVSQQPPLYPYPSNFNDSTLDVFLGGSFPPGFKFGVGSSAYQIEGAWNVDGKGESIWDVFTHTPSQREKGTGDDADKSYYLWQTDIENMKLLGVQFYRFSLSWPRLLPNGTSSFVNQKGVEYYNTLIDALLEAGIEPLVTMLHWDLPQALQDMGGITSDQMPDWFEDYADFCFKTFGKKVKLWNTFNEPYTTSLCFETGACAPGPDYVNPGISCYKSVHQQLLSHGRAYRLYQQKYKRLQGGKIGIVASTGYHQAYNLKSNLDQAAADKALQFQLGWILSPLLGNAGNYPLVMINTIAELSEYQGFKESRLPKFTYNESRMLMGALDFLSYNYYGSDMSIYKSQEYSMQPSMFSDLSVQSYLPPQWIQTQLSFDRTYPQGFRKVLQWINQTYGQIYPIEIFITENGYAGAQSTAKSPCDATFDLDRMKYLVAHLDQLHRSIYEDKIPITRYSHWALMDTYNYGNGYQIKFGLFCVDYSAENRTRTARDSATLYRNIINLNGFDNKQMIDRLQEFGVLQPLQNNQMAN